MSLGIFFDNTANVYKPGESVSGKVTADLTEPLAVKGVRLTIHGWAYVYWTRSSSSSSSSSRHTYWGREDFLLNTITVWGNPSTASPQAPTPILPAGRHTFNFSFPLPDRLPGTFYFYSYGNYGKIEYLIRANMERPTPKVDIMAERLFIVYPIYNLNLNPDAALPQKMERWKDIGCWCCAAGRVGVVISLPKSGYASGEAIAATIDIMNHSRRTVEMVTMTLMQHIQFKSSGDFTWSHSERRPLQGCIRGRSRYKELSVKPGKTQRSVIDEIRVPNDTAFAYPTLEFPLSKVLNISYTVVFEFSFNGCVLPLVVDLPVMIGTGPVIAATTP